MRKYNKKMYTGARGARIQFEIGIALILIIPFLTFYYLLTREDIGRLAALSSYWPALLIMVLLIGLGCWLLSTYPVTVIKLRKYLEDMVEGDLPAEVIFANAEDDIHAIEACMNILVERLKAHIGIVESEQNMLEHQLDQAQKLKSIGALAAGIAHEIRTPMQAIGDNARFLGKASEEMLQLIDTYKLLLEQAQHEPGLDVATSIQSAEDRANLTLLKEEAPRAATQTIEEIKRLKKIVTAVRDFSHLGSTSSSKEPADINQAIESTLIIATSEWKPAAELEMRLDPQLPMVPCFVTDVKQALLNLITNAAHAIVESTDTDHKQKGLITIATRYDDHRAYITISDTGNGIPESIKSKVFDSFFTTKKAGEGTGQGLAMARSYIVKKHDGLLTFETKEGSGTTFTIGLPLESARA